jgi:hypothetical protein
VTGATAAAAPRPAATTAPSETALLPLSHAAATDLTLGRCAARALAAAMLAVLAPHAAAADELTAAQIAGRVSGVYALAEWQVDGQRLRPPAVEGRFTLLDGTITTILRDRSRADGERTSVFIGHYRIDGLTFRYGYDDVSQFSEAATGPSASHRPLWEGLRAFHASRDADGLTLTAESGQQFVFSDDGLTYLENHAVVRRWRRIGSR